MSALATRRLDDRDRRVFDAFPSAARRIGRPVASGVRRAGRAGRRRSQHQNLGAELLYALDLDDLVVPESIASGELSVRRTRPDEQGLLAQWRADYMVEALGYPDNAATRAEAATDMAAVFADGEPRDLFVLLEEDRVVATSAFNARLPELVQIGGVWTPAADRGRGLGRAVVAGQLLHARAEGVRRSVLFTGESNTPARRAYEALGYRQVGDYGLTLFAAPIDVL